MTLPRYVLIIDALALLAVALGYLLAFRPRLFRRGPPRPREADPARMIMLIAGVMLMAFALAMAILFTIFSLDTATA